MRLGKRLVLTAERQQAFEVSRLPVLPATDNQLLDVIS